MEVVKLWSALLVSLSAALELLRFFRRMRDSAMLIKLTLERPLVVFTIRTMPAALRAKRGGGARGTLSLERNIC